MSELLGILAFAALFAVFGLLRFRGERARGCPGCDGACGGVCPPDPERPIADQRSRTRGSGRAEPGRDVRTGSGGSFRSRPDLAVGPEPSRRGPSRREFLVLGTGALVVLSIPRAAGGQRRRLVRRTVPAMGSFAEIVIPADDAERANAAIAAAVAELRSVEARLTRFRPDSDVGRANLARPGEATPVSPETASELEAALAWARITEGRFDPGLARAIVLWDVGSRRAPPPPDAVRRFAGRGLYRHLELDRGAGGGWKLRLHHPDTGVDLGGIGKGVGVDRAVRALRAHGVRDGLVNLGGDLYALGRSEDGDPWKIGLRSPDRPSAIAETLDVIDGAVATSGDYVRYFEHGGRRYHHLLDPATGEPGASAWRSVTVTAASCMAADAAATALFGLDPTLARTRLAEWAPGARAIHLT